MTFLAAVAVGTALLSLPVAAADGTGVGVVDALFTAVSAVCVTGLVVLDTATAWSGFGLVVILLLIQLGGFGMMLAGTSIAYLFVRRARMRTQLAAQTELGVASVGELPLLVRRVGAYTLTVEGLVAVALTARFATVYDLPVARAAWFGLFHAVSAFCNAGFALFSTSLETFAGDPLVLLPVVGAVVIGGVGFPVISEVLSVRRPRHWSLHTKITLWATAVLLAGGAAAFGVAESANPDTFGALGPVDRAVGALTLSAMPRTAGFNAVDMSALSASATLVVIVLMFIGGGAASTAGGVKVSTVGVLVAAAVAEMRGEGDTVAFHRRIPTAALRQALTVVGLAGCAVLAGTVALSATSDVGLGDALFETASALSTVGLSRGVTSSLDTFGKLLISVLMFAGRVGPLTLGAALLARQTSRRWRYAPQRPLVG